MSSEQQSEALEEIFVGRQPIFNREQGTVGYELLFRAGHENEAHVTSQRAATADVVCKVFAELGLANALGNQRGFINVDEDFLFDDAVELLPNHMVVLDIKLQAPPSARLVERAQQLMNQGYQLSLSGISAVNEELKPLLALASYVRVDVLNQNESFMATAVEALHGDDRKLIASRVESEAQMLACKTQGFDLFQGYYFAQPVIIEGRKLDPATTTLLQLINLLNEDAEASKLENAFKAEPALSINLLRLTNSVGAGVTTRVTSIRHAITVVGRRQLTRWLQLLLFAKPGQGAGVAHNPLMQWAAMRGYFMELVAGRTSPDRRELRDQAFMMGLMSLMPLALGMSMEDILSRIAVTPDVRKALLEREGQLGALLDLTEAYDNNDMAATSAVFPRLGRRITLQTLGLCLAEAITWVQQLGTEAD
jgi:EAL and modified HD-GYP domain-containing signal transduction protein